MWGPSRHLGSLTTANWVSFDFNVAYYSCWDYSLINTLKLKKQRSHTLLINLGGSKKARKPNDGVRQIISARRGVSSCKFYTHSPNSDSKNFKPGKKRMSLLKFHGHGHVCSATAWASHGSSAGDLLSWIERRRKGCLSELIESRNSSRSRFEMLSYKIFHNFKVHNSTRSSKLPSQSVNGNPLGLRLAAK